MAADQTTLGPREKLALQRLAHARAEDAEDASLPPCKLCGGKAVRLSWAGGESTGGGYHSVRCENGDQEQRIDLDVLKSGSGWRDARFWTWNDAEAEVLRRWRALNV